MSFANPQIERGHLRQVADEEIATGKCRDVPCLPFEDREARDFLMAIGIVAMLGPGLFQIMIAIGIINVPLFARLLRGAVLAQRENDFVLAARAVGVPRRSILGSHILPNAISPVIVAATLALATAIIDAAGLGFLGLGPQDPSTPEWGTMLTNTVRFLQTAPHLAIIPGVAIVITAISINLIGDGLREALDPKLRTR